MCWFGNVLTGDLGGSIASGETVAGRSIPPPQDPQPCFALVSSSRSSSRTGRENHCAAAEAASLDYVASAVAFVGVSMPSFWIGIYLILTFAVQLRWLPAIGYSEIAEDGFGRMVQATDPAQPGDRRRLSL